MKQSATGLLFTSPANYAHRLAEIDLLRYFSRRQVRQYFGARTTDELLQVVRLMDAMSGDERRRFKRELQKVAAHGVTQ